MFTEQRPTFFVNHFPFKKFKKGEEKGDLNFFTALGDYGKGANPIALKLPLGTGIGSG
jgi:hypothetical protein